MSAVAQPTSEFEARCALEFAERQMQIWDELYRRAGRNVTSRMNARKACFAAAAKVRAARARLAAIRAKQAQT